MSATVFDEEYMSDPSPRPIKARPLGTLAALMIGVSALTVLAGSLAFLSPPPEPQAAQAQPAEELQPLSPPRPTEVKAEPAARQARKEAGFDLAAAEFANEKKSYAVRALDESGGREDSLTLGQLAGDGAYLRIDIAQSPAIAASDFYLDMTRHAREAGLAVKKIGPPGGLATRFGRFETADIRLTSTNAASAAPTERSCLATRLLSAAPAMEIAGVVCGVDRANLACVLDQLEYRPAGADEGLAAFFQKAGAAHGQGCGAAEAKKPAQSAPGAAHAKVNKKKIR